MTRRAIRNEDLIVLSLHKPKKRVSTCTKKNRQIYFIGRDFSAFF